MPPFLLPPLFLLLVLLTFDLLLWVVAFVWTSESRQAAVHVELGQAVHLALAAVSALQARVAHGQGQSVNAGPAGEWRESSIQILEPEEEVGK